MKRKKKHKTKAKKLADKIEKAMAKGGNPFKGIKFTEEEREILALVGCV